MVLRIIFNILIFGSILFLPWWVTAIIAVGFLSKFNAYEVLFWGVFADILYSVPVEDFYNIQFLFTAGSVVFFITIYFIKKRLILYDT